MAVNNMLTQPPVTGSTQVVLRRDRGDNPMGGVAAGVANYLGIDVVLVRVAFVALILATFGIGWAVYFVLWFVMPQEQEGELVRLPSGSVEQRRARAVAGVLLVAIAGGVAAVQLVPGVKWEHLLVAAVALVGVLVALSSRIGR